MARHPGLGRQFEIKSGHPVVPLPVGTLGEGGKGEVQRAVKTKFRARSRFKKTTKTYADAAWELRFQELNAYRRQHGHCRVPSCSKTHPSLGYWVSHQRILYRSGRLKAARRKRLEQIGFDWVSRGRSAAFRDSTYWDTLWERMLDKLARFHRRFGHCRVPVDWAGTPSLSGWVKRQRRLKQQGMLRQDRWRHLQTLGLDWKIGVSLDPRWEHSFERLLQYRRRFGHCRVPAEWVEDFKLGQWVVKMRRLKRTDRLSSEKVRRLNEVGFVWDVARKREAEQEAGWSKWLAKLHTFHQQHGHWRVPTNQHKFHGLRVWMDNQRINYHRGWLSAERIRRLEEMQFPWISERRQLASRD